MRCEIPEFARCCFCFPLRFGLLVFAYLKLVILGNMLLSMFGFILSEIGRKLPLYDFPLFLIIIIFMIFFAVDVVFHIVLIISAHTKKHKVMRIFYREALFGLALYVFGLIYVIVYIVTVHIFFGLLIVIWSLFFWLIFMQAYLLILVRSEVLKLERNINNHEFTNNTAEEVITVDTNSSIA